MAADWGVHNVESPTDHMVTSTKPASSTAPPYLGPNILDIRRSSTQFSLVEEIRKGLHPASGQPKTLPTLLLYNETGLKLFEQITYLEEYYPTNTEIGVLEKHAASIAQLIKPGSIIVELGSGNLRKVDILLQAIERLEKPVEYYALDVSLTELQRTLCQVPHETYKFVQCFGLFGTYDDGLAWLRSPSPRTSSRPKMLLSLGSSLGNFTSDEAAGFLRGFSDALNEHDSMLISIDGCKDPERVHRAYNDTQGITHQFTLNGLAHANQLLGFDAFEEGVWTAIGRYDEAGGRHQAFVVPQKDVSILGADIKAGEPIRIEESHKFSPEDLNALWAAASLQEITSWPNDRRDYAMHLVSSPKYAFSLNPEKYAAAPVPSWEEWQQIWRLWDTITRRMIPKEELLEKPIKLRNACIFYLGHIPTFVDMKLTEVTEAPLTQPSYFSKIFERGIDPDVDDPEKCHKHSAIPDDWPPLNEILEYQERVRDRIKGLYASGECDKPKVSRGLWLGYEHEAMHLETLLYMLVQSEKTLPPPECAIPSFEALAEQDEVNAVPNEWIKVPSQTLTLNMDDAETPDGPRRYFGWDIEKPRHEIHVPAFQAKARPITNGEYAEYLYNTGRVEVPTSWTEYSSSSDTTGNSVNGKGVSLQAGSGSVPMSYFSNKSVRTVLGAVPLALALHWPVSASYDELAGCAVYMGGRIPTLEEARSIYAYADSTQNKITSQALGRTIPAVNSHLVNDGVEESPPSGEQVNDDAGSQTPNPHSHFFNLQGANVGFQNWHPVAVTHHGDKLTGQAGMGGLWEWTSSPLRRIEGYQPMPLYPAYSQDFFDDKHNIVLGGSWATLPRLAGRKSFVNWYQHNYPYVWAGARLVRDINGGNDDRMGFNIHVHNVKKMAISITYKICENAAERLKCVHIARGAETTTS